MPTPRAKAGRTPCQTFLSPSLRLRSLPHTRPSVAPARASHLRRRPAYPPTPCTRLTRTLAPSAPSFHLDPSLSPCSTLHPPRPSSRTLYPRIFLARPLARLSATQPSATQSCANGTVETAGPVTLAQSNLSSAKANARFPKQEEPPFAHKLESSSHAKQRRAMMEDDMHHAAQSEKRGAPLMNILDYLATEFATFEH